MKPYAVARTLDNVLQECEALGPEIRSAVRLLASLLHQEFDLGSEEVHLFRLEFEVNEDAGAPCMLALYMMEEDEDAFASIEAEPDYDDEI